MKTKLFYAKAKWNSLESDIYITCKALEGVPWNASQENKQLIDSCFVWP